ncbi:MAG TPA: glycoside hydrolase family 3 N-terminal domain-containing protein [Candidatus Sulfomarinibacteraceae bacterium]|nr:glycoside hydrolase family 3 N-terminal domain-containing protein [Candidatus Sulfomarinibacteraceae bacterium]
MAKSPRVIIIFLYLLSMLLSPGAFTQAQDGVQADGEVRDYRAQAQALLDELTVTEKVGQLFLVTFRGTSTGAGDAITDLVLRHKVGGVVLLAENDNIQGGGEETPLQVAALTNRLQEIALVGEAAVVTDTISGEDGDAAADPANAETEAAEPGTPIPLLIATQQEGDGPPFSQIRGGVTELPSSMAVGATWQPSYAEEVGRISGREMAALGINMLLGPSLDVLEQPNPSSPSDLGVRTFGGDPYWVGLMGRAYTTGVHDGADGRVALVARHFPGRGSSDRPLDEEVSTVRKSLEQLKQVELAPFFAVTDGEPGLGSVTDGLLVTHIRYQGFQGNLRDTTAPVSFDPPALQTLMSLPEFSAWRQEGGILVSDALGVRAVQRFYDNSGQEFPHRHVAKDALLAGNDLLYVDKFAFEADDFDSQLANLLDTITWFQERYLTDPAFQQRTDEAVLRVLELKLRLYDGDFSPENVQIDPALLDEQLRQREGAILNLAQDAITLISPSQGELQERLPRPPGPGDQIVIFTDVRQGQQCSDCTPQPYISQTSLEERIMALYGPEGSDQITAEHITSFSFGDLTEFLDAGPGPVPPPTPEPELTEETPEPGESPEATPTIDYSPEFQVQSALQSAEWIIFVTLDVTPNIADSYALKRLLAERPDIVRNTRTLVFSYDAPYYLDTTEVSKLTAYYGVFSKQSAFIDASARVLFQEASLRGASPVDISSVDYHLFEVTQPDPAQVIDLFLLRDGSPEAPPSEEPMELVVGDTLRLRTGVIYDHNGQPVPDGTPVQFIQQDRLQGFTSVIGERPTQNGVAEIDYVLEARTGQFRITAAAGEATNSQQVDVAIGDNVRVVLVTLTPAPTPLPTNTRFPTSTPSPSPTPSPTPTVTPTPVPPPPEPRIEIFLPDLFMLLGVIGGLSLTALAAVFITRLTGNGDPHLLVRLVGFGFVGGLLLYNYFALDLPGTEWLSNLGSLAAVVTTGLGGVAGILVGWRQPDQKELSRRQRSAGD